MQTDCIIKHGRFSIIIKNNHTSIRKKLLSSKFYKVFKLINYSIKMSSIGL